jgi:hypothetical protein
LGNYRECPPWNQGVKQLFNSIRIVVLSFSILAFSAGPSLPQEHMNHQSSGGDPVQFLFIHHSCGGQLLADLGESSGQSCIYVSHPNGGGLRGKLEEIGYQVNEASYGSIVGEDTDICHWNAKFRDQMDRILKTRNQDELLPEGVTNNIVAFKSCFPNNHFVGEGSMPGDPDSCTLTVANAKAAYQAILPYLAQHPDVLFVAFTAPPLAETQGFKGFVKKILRKGTNPAMAREFNNWLVDEKNGWLAGYAHQNIAVFDHYDVLTGYGKSNSLVYPTGGGSDSHPSSEGNSEAAKAFVPFIQKSLGKLNQVGS